MNLKIGTATVETLYRMVSFRTSRHELLIDFNWCPFWRFSDWMLAAQRWDDPFFTRLLWLGPVHIAFNRQAA